MTRQKIDTADVAPYAWGRFILRFNWAESDRCTFTYHEILFGRTRTVRGEIRHSLAGLFREQWNAGKLDPDSPFIRYFFHDEARAMDAWRHICRVAQLTLRIPT